MDDFDRSERRRFQNDTQFLAKAFVETVRIASPLDIGECGKGSYAPQFDVRKHGIDGVEALEVLVCGAELEHAMVWAQDEGFQMRRKSFFDARPCLY